MSDLKIHALNYLVGCFNKDHEIVTPEVVEEAQKELDAIRKEKSKRRRMSEEEAVDQASARHDSLLELKRIPLPPLDRGWYWFGFTYRTTEGRPFEVNFAAQSMEDAETRVRMMRETAQFDGQVIAEYEATDADVAHARRCRTRSEEEMEEQASAEHATEIERARGTVPGTSMVCIECGCRWKKHADGWLQLYDADQKPCPRCDNAPNPPLRNEEPPDEDEQGAGAIETDVGAPPHARSHSSASTCVHEAFQVVGDTARCHACHNLFTLFRPEPLEPSPPPAPAQAGWTSEQRVAARDLLGEVLRTAKTYDADAVWIPEIAMRELCAALSKAAPHFHKVRVRLPELPVICAQVRAEDVYRVQDIRDRQWTAALRAAGVEIEGEQ